MQLPVDLIEQRRDLREHFHEFFLVPKLWRGYAYGGSLLWRTVPLRASRAAGLPPTSGVYALIVKSGVASRLGASYLMYVGKSNSIRRRFRDYLRESKSSVARPKLAILLRLYAKHLHFRYALVAPPHRDVAETELIGALLPPANDQVPAVIRAARAAF